MGLRACLTLAPRTGPWGPPVYAPWGARNAGHLGGILDIWAQERVGWEWGAVDV